MAVNVKSIQELRERTGAGMMDCKKALEHSDGDIEKAIDWLRENGIAKAAKKSGRIAAEGTTYVAINGNDAVLVEVNSETDFVAMNDSFRNLVKEIAEVLVKTKPANLEEALKVTDGNETLNDKIVNATAKIGEKITLRRFALVSKKDDEIFGSYLHMGGKKGSVVVLKSNDPEVATDIAMQVVASVPLYINKTDVPSEYIEKELKIRLEASKANGRELTNPKAIEGLKNKIAEEISLVEQDFIKEDKTKVGQFLKQHNSTVVSMVYYVVGEGLEKREDNFVEEVMSQMNK